MSGRTPSAPRATVRGMVRAASTTRVVTAVSTAAAAVSVAAFVAISTLIAVVTPYRMWDAFAFGSWSRFFAESGGTFQMNNPVSGDTLYQRPLFYVAQGLLWLGFGFHVTLGRLLSLAFSLVLLGSLVVLGRRTSLRTLGGVLAALVMILVVDFEKGVDAGLTDVPAAAMVALTAALYRPDSKWRSVRYAVLGPAAFLAVVSKSTAVVAVGAFAVAEVLGPRAELRRRAVALAPVAAGILAGLAYFVHESNVFHESLYAFLRSGNSPYYQAAADRLRADALLRGDVLGSDLRLVLWFGVLYALLRVVGLRHRLAATAAAPTAIVASWVVPAFAAGGTFLGPLAGGVDLHDVAYFVLAALLPLVVLVPESDAASRLRLARLLVWWMPIVVLWYQHAVYAPRLISPAWPPLVLLMLEVVALIVLGARRLAPALAVAPVAALVLVFALLLPNVDGFGSALWHRFWSIGPSGWGNAATMRSFALGPLDDEVSAVADQVGSRGRVISSDSRLRFFFGDRVTADGPTACDQLSGYGAFVLLLDPDSATLMEQGRPGSSKPQFWQACTAPPVTLLRDVPGSFAAFAIGAPRALCTNPPAATGMTAIFGSGLSYAAAVALRNRVAAVGFTAAAVEPLSCADWRVALGGFTSMANFRDFAAEAKRAGFPVTLLRQ